MPNALLAAATRSAVRRLAAARASLAGRLLSRSTGGSRPRPGVTLPMQVGMSMTGAALAYAVVSRGRTARPELRACEFRLMPRLQDPALALRPLFQQHGLEGVPANYVLHGDEYQLLMVEAPAVPETEMREALRWQIQDALRFPAAEAVIDICPMPVPFGEGGRPLLAVVASRKTLVTQRSSLVERCGLSLQVLETPEFALRNLATHLSVRSGGAVALLHFGGERSLIQVVHGATLYLTRSLAPGYERYDEADEEGRAALLQHWASEVVRTLEYYESRVMEPAITAVYLAPLGEALPTLAALLQEATALPVRPLVLEEVLDMRAPLPVERQARCLLAVGAALGATEAS